MTSMHDNKIGFGKELNQIIFDITEKYNYPKCFDFPLGHIKENTLLLLVLQFGFQLRKIILL